MGFLELRSALTDVRMAKEPGGGGSGLVDKQLLDLILEKRDDKSHGAA